MSDDFLSGMREEPRPEFAGRIEERLREIDRQQRERRAASGPLRRLAPALAGALLVAAVAVAFTLEPVRAAAREFLDLFRVKRFAAVPVDPERLGRLQQGGLDLRSLVAEQIQVTVPPQKPEIVAGPEAGAVAAGIEVQQPSVLPRGMELVESSVARPGSFRVQLDATKLEALAQAAGADEIEIPVSWNGATIDVAMPPLLLLSYARRTEGMDVSTDPEDRLVFVQASSPEVALPEGVDLATLGRLGLRVSGMSREEAESFARAIDWRATLLVPVPVRGGSFREVEVSGHKGLLVTAAPPRRAAPDGSPRRARSRSVLMWASAEKVYAIHGSGNGLELLEMAQSVR